MFKVMTGGEGVMGVSHVQGDGRKCRGVSMFKVMGGVSAMFKVMGGEGRQPCSR